MGVRGRRREQKAALEAEEVDDHSVDDDDLPEVFIPASLVESETDDLLQELCEEYRRVAPHLRYVCAGDLRLWVRRYPTYPEKDAKLSPQLGEFLRTALGILEDEQSAPCSEDLPEFPTAPRCKLLGSLRYQLCQRLTKYYVPQRDPLRVPQFW